MKVFRYKIVLIILCVIYIFLYYADFEVNRNTLTIIGWFGLLQLIVSTLSWRNNGKSIISPYYFFLIALYLFSFGQSLLYPFNLVCEKRDLYESYSLYYGFSVKDIYLAQIQTLLMLNVFHIAGLKYSTKINYSSGSAISKASGQNNRLKQIGWVLFAISIIPFSYDTIMDMITSMTMGYRALYEAEAKIGIANSAKFIAAYFIPSIICLFIAYRHNKSIRKFLTVIVLGVSIAYLIIGGRSNAVILLGLIVILYQYLVKPFSKKVLLVGFVGAFFFLQILSYIANTRNDVSVNSSSTIELSDNAAVEAISEMGWSQFCLIKSMQFVPSKEDFRYGRSYIFAFTSIIPNLGFWPIHPAKKESNLGDWLTDTLGTTFGTGFSMCAEAWVNFGVFGFLIFYLWGALLGSIFGRIEKVISEEDIALLAFLLVLFWFCLKIPRNAFLNVVRAVFYYAAPIYIVCNNFRIRKK